MTGVQTCALPIYAKKYGAAAPVLLPKETIGTMGKGDILFSVPPRDSVRIIQTPQAFRYDILMKCLTMANEADFLGTDESSLVLQSGHGVKCIEGLPFNIKITSGDDIERAEQILRNT